MDKRVVFAVAGSGKTRSIVNALSQTRRALVVTYTTNTCDDLRRRVIGRFGHVPDHVTILTYFSFLYRFCYKPYLADAVRDTGISYKLPSQRSNACKADNINRYLDGSRRLYHCRIGKLLEVAGCLDELPGRIERYFDDVFVDEVQDFGGHDFNLLKAMASARVSWNVVGDFYQHTFSTSHDSGVNKSLHDDYVRYQKQFQKAGFSVDLKSLTQSHRCTAPICEFISSRLGIAIQSASCGAGQVEEVTSQSEVDSLCADPEIVKLFYQEHHKYECYSMNWAAAKGLDHFNDVCVVLNKSSWKHYECGTLSSLAPITRNKLYVACSRARHRLFVVPERLVTGFRRA